MLFIAKIIFFFSLLFSATFWMRFILRNCQCVICSSFPCSWSNFSKAKSNKKVESLKTTLIHFDKNGVAYRAEKERIDLTDKD